MCLFSASSPPGDVKHPIDLGSLVNNLGSGVGFIPEG
jgi:hypothetical protein